jgi:hypothetical protein
MKTLLAIVSIVLVCTGIFAQTVVKPGLTDDEINDLSSNLAMKLILNDSQENEIISLLKSYRSDLSKVMGSSVQESQNKVMSATNEKIVALLDSKQQMKFNVISADWWDSVQKAQNN